jgi:hypothetical protein
MLRSYIGTSLAHETHTGKSTLRQQSHHRHQGMAKGLLSLCLLGAPVALGYLGYHLAVSQTTNQIVSQEAAETWQQQLDEQAQTITHLRRNAEEQLEALTLRLATLQARLLRLDALGERLNSGDRY